MKGYWRKALIIAVLVILNPLTALSNDYLFYKYSSTKHKFELKALYFYTENAQINKFRAIRTLQKSSYKNLGNSGKLLIRNSRGFITATKLINLRCKMRNNKYKIIIGAVAGSSNPMGQCGAFNSHWVEITKNNRVILPRTVFQTCGSNHAISTITANAKGQIAISKINVYSQIPVQSRHTNIKKRVIYIGQAPDSIAADKFGNIWAANYQSGNIAKINQNGKAAYYNVDGHPTSIAVDSIGNVFAVVGNHIVKLTQKGEIARVYKVTKNLNTIFIDPRSDIWVDDWKNGKVFKLDENGNIIKRYQAGSGASQMVMDKAGNLWIAASYGHLKILYPNGTIKKCPLCCVNNIAAENNTVWAAEGKLLNNSVVLKHIGLDCQYLPTSYKLDIQPAGLAIDNRGKIWISGSRKDGRGFLEEISKTKKIVYSLGKFSGPLVIDKYGNLWVISGAHTVTEFFKLIKPAQYQRSLTNPSSGINPHLPIAVRHTFPENGIGK